MGGLGQFADLKGDLAKKRGMVLFFFFFFFGGGGGGGGLIPNAHFVLACQ